MNKRKRRTRRIVDFPDDPMMQELHDVRRKLEQAMQGMSPKEAARYINEKAKRFEERMEQDSMPAGKET